MSLSKADKLFITNEISNKMHKEVTGSEQSLRGYFEVKFDLLEKRVKVLPTSEEFLSRMDRWWTEYKKISNEQLFATERISRNTNRIENLESKVGS